MSATFEVYEDRAGEWRWRLRHRNGNVIADSGEGYASRDGAVDAAERVRGHAPDADALDVGSAAFEIFEDSAGEWRWRLRHRNGNVIADSGEGYASRDGAEGAVENVREYMPEADLLDIGRAVFEAYEDQLSEGADIYDEFTTDYLEAVNEQISLLIESHEGLESQTVETLEAAQNQLKDTQTEVEERLENVQAEVENVQQDIQDSLEA
jgi:uncharacterized protein YegP (UPF0339 family)